MYSTRTSGEEDILFKKTFTLDFRVSREKSMAKWKKCMYGMEQRA